MKYIYTSDASLENNFCECIFNNLPDTKGLWLPKNIPIINKTFISNLNQYSFIDIAKNVLDVFIEDIPKKKLHTIIEKSFDSIIKHLCKYSKYYNFTLLILDNEYHKPLYNTEYLIFGKYTSNFGFIY